MNDAARKVKYSIQLIQSPLTKLTLNIADSLLKLLMEKKCILTKTTAIKSDDLVPIKRQSNHSVIKRNQ